MAVLLRIISEYDVKNVKIEDIATDEALKTLQEARLILGEFSIQVYNPSFEKYKIFRNFIVFTYECVIMKYMRKFLFSFLVLLMIMPSLLCAMPSCADKEGSVAQSEQPCANHYSNGLDGDNDINQVNLLLDCMSVDLQKGDPSSYDKANFETDLVAYDFLTVVLADPFAEIDSNSIRGSPSSPDIYPTNLPVYQTTKRFRL